MNTEIVYSTCVEQIAAHIAADLGAAEGHHYLDILNRHHTRLAKKAWRHAPKDSGQGMVVIVHERQVYGQSIPTIVSLETLEHDATGQKKKWVCFMAYVEAMTVPQIQMLISAQRATGHDFGVHYGVNKGALN